MVNIKQTVCETVDDKACIVFMVLFVPCVLLLLRQVSVCCEKGGQDPYNLTSHNCTKVTSPATLIQRKSGVT